MSIILWMPAILLALLLFSACASSDGPRATPKQKEFGEGVKDTFLHVGGELQEFFTGDRTVDQ